MTRKESLFGWGSYLWLGLCVLIGASTFGLLKATGEGWTHPSLASYQHQLCDYVQCKNGYDDPPLQHWETRPIEFVKSEQQLTIRTQIKPIELPFSTSDSLRPIPELKLTLTDLSGQQKQRVFPPQLYLSDLDTIELHLMPLDTEIALAEIELLPITRTN